MTDDDKAETATAKLAHRIDLLMDAPPAERPTIIVVGDESVSSITLPPNPSDNKG